MSVCSMLRTPKLRRVKLCARCASSQEALEKACIKWRVRVVDEEE